MFFNLFHKVCLREGSAHPVAIFVLSNNLTQQTHVIPCSSYLNMFSVFKWEFYFTQKNFISSGKLVCCLGYKFEFWGWMQSSICHLQPLTLSEKPIPAAVERPPWSGHQFITGLTHACIQAYRQFRVTFQLTWMSVREEAMQTQEEHANSIQINPGLNLEPCERKPLYHQQNPMNLIQNYMKQSPTEYIFNLI